MNLLIAPGVVMPALSNSQHYSSIWQHGRMIGLNKPLLHNLFWGPAKSLSEAEMWDECDKTRSQMLHGCASAFRRRVGAVSTFWPYRPLSLPSIPLHLPGGHRRGLTWLVLQLEGRQVRECNQRALLWCWEKFCGVTVTTPASILSLLLCISIGDGL